jgi:hypothetical protein
MLQRGHRLELGSESIIGWVTAHNQPRIAEDVAEDPMHLKNPLLPETRSEAGIPIRAGNTVLGAIDVQSTQARAFGPETVVMLQTLANQMLRQSEHVPGESSQTNMQEWSDSIAPVSSDSAQPPRRWHGLSSWRRLSAVVSPSRDSLELQGRRSQASWSQCSSSSGS